MTSHFFISDMQVRPDVDMHYLGWVGHYIIKRKPDVIVCIGDFADFPSLSSYDKGKLQFEGRRYKADIRAASQGMNLMLARMRDYNALQRARKHAQYLPRMVMCLGNHEQRIQRVVESNPELEGMLSYDDLPYQDWEVVDYLKPIDINGVHYVHFLANPYTGKPYGGSALNQLAKVGKSFIVGHKQTLDVCTRYTLDGKQQWGIVCGAGYPHDEPYKGHQGNPHYRGHIWLDNVKDGSFDPSFVSLDFLKQQYEER